MCVCLNGKGDDKRFLEKVWGAKGKKGKEVVCVLFLGQIPLLMSGGSNADDDDDARYTKPNPVISYQLP